VNQGWLRVTVGICTLSRVHTTHGNSIQHSQQCRASITSCLQHGTGWENDGPKAMQATNTRNWICQLRSVAEVSHLWEKHSKRHPDEYAAVAFMRPDVHYQDAFPVHVIPSLKVCALRNGSDFEHACSVIDFAKVRENGRNNAGRQV
jgi:hypothetical protein